MLASPEIKSPNDFSNHEDWEQYVLETIAAEQVAYALEFGRTRRFLRFYELRDKQFPDEFTDEVGRLQVLDDPERTDGLRTLNGRIFADMTSFLMEAACAEHDVVIDEPPVRRSKDCWLTSAKRIRGLRFGSRIRTGLSTPARAPGEIASVRR